MNSPDRMAKMTLEFVNRAPMNGNEAEAVVAVKQWLQQIGSGQLIVGAPVQPKARKPENITAHARVAMP